MGELFRSLGRSVISKHRSSGWLTDSVGHRAVGRCGIGLGPIDGDRERDAVYARRRVQFSGRPVRGLW